MLIIGLVGPFGGGKTSTAKYLVEKGFFNVRLSQFIEEEIEKRKLGSVKDRKLLQDVGNELRKVHGSDILAKKALKQAMDKKVSKLVIDGIRNVDELKLLKNQDPAYIFGIDADQKLRLLRLRESKERIQLTKEEFIKLEAREKGKGQRGNGLQEKQCWKLRDFEILNNESKHILFQQVDQILELIDREAIRIILLGPPGAGKSTQGRLLARKLNVPWISMGELLRDAYKKGTPEGIEWWEKFGSKGLNAPIALKNKILEKRLLKANNGFILDDFPRTREDLEAHKEYITKVKVKIDKVILIKVPEKTSISRVLKRWKRGVQRGVARYDDSLFVLKVRIKEGYKKELPYVIDYFQQKRLLTFIDGNGRKTVDQVNREIINTIFNH